MTVEKIRGIPYDWDDGYTIADGNLSMAGFSEDDALRYIALYIRAGEDARLMFNDAEREPVREALRPLARKSCWYAESMDRDSCPCKSVSVVEYERDKGVFWNVCEDCGEVHNYLDMEVLEHYAP